MFRDYMLRAIPGRELPSRPAKQIMLETRRKTRVEHLRRPKPLV